MRIAMIGGGYVGLVSAACFAEFGTDVTVVEADGGKLAALRDGRMPIYEPGLDKLVAENVAARRHGPAPPWLPPRLAMPGPRPRCRTSLPSHTWATRIEANQVPTRLFTRTRYGQLASVW
jgi:hypothetical protein